MADFNIGDVVQLKSGGPLMTVTSIEEESGFIEAVWFDGTKRETESFPLGAVFLVQNPRPNPRQGRAFFQKSP